MPDATDPGKNDLNFERLLQHSWDIVSVLSEEGRLLYNSPACERIHGYTQQELLGKQTGDLIHPDDREAVQTTLLWILDHPHEPRMVEYRYSCKDGTWVWMEAVGVNYLGDPAIRGVVTNSRDISERKSSSQRLVEEEDFLKKIFDTTYDAIYVTDLETNQFLDVNRAFETITGYSKESIVGKTSLEVDLWFLPAERAAYYEAFRKDGFVRNRLIHVRHRQGYEVWAEASSTLMDWKGRSCLVSTSRDVTERVRLEERRKQLEEQLHQTQKLESLGSLAGGVAHEMNNVLAAILGVASVHAQTVPSDSRLGHDLDTIVKSCQRGGALVKSLLGFARRSPAQIGRVDLNALVDEAVNLLARTAFQTVPLKVEKDPRIGAVAGDSAALSHVLLNLCVNAADALAASPGPGVVRIRTRATPDGFVLLEVEDNGQGMTKEIQDQAFNPFFTTKPQGKGTGLGLSLAHSTIQAHSGRLELVSSVGVGTTVRVFLPVDNSVLPVSESPPAAPRPHRPLSLLIVDDDESVLDAMGEMAEALGHRPTKVTSGESALTRIQGGFAPDLMILDMNMPGQGGAVTLVKIRELQPALPVLLVTGRADQKALDLLHRHSGLRLLPKPFMLDEIDEGLQALVPGC